MVGNGATVAAEPWKVANGDVMRCEVSESYSVLDLPEMVIAAESEQPEGVVLVYDRQQVDEFELLGDEEAKEMERMIPDEESEDEDEEDEL